MVTGGSLDVDADELLGFLAALMRYRRHALDTLPEHVARMKKQLDKMKVPDSSVFNEIDHELLYRIGLAILSRSQDPMPMGELSKALEVAVSTATRMVDELVKGGLAQRVADPEDRRIVRVALTEQGQQLYRITTTYIRERVDQLLVNFTSEEANEFVRLLRKAVGNMNEQRAG